VGIPLLFRDCSSLFLTHSLHMKAELKSTKYYIKFDVSNVILDNKITQQNNLGQDEEQFSALNFCLRMQ